MLRLCLRRGFAARRFVAASHVESDPKLKQYFEDRLSLWTKQYFQQTSGSMVVYEDSISEEKRAKLDQLAKLVAYLSPEERWLVGDYVEKGTLGSFIRKNTPSGISQNTSNIDKCKPD